MASRQAPARRDLERELVRATRALFDERGAQDAPIEEIAQAVGIARGLVYRHFSSMEELFVFTVTDYLAELAEALELAVSDASGAEARLARCTEAYAAFCLRYPAFLDSTLMLMRRPARELQELVSDSVWLRLGQGMASCLDLLAETLREGNESGVFAVEDPDYTANVLWAQGIGVMHLARIGVGVRRLAPGVPGLFSLEPEQVVRTCVQNALATVSGEPSRQGG
jgi:AcrR family transcriptional regulator